MAHALWLVAAGIWLGPPVVPARAESETDVKLPGSVAEISFLASADGSKQRYVRALPKAFHPDRVYDILIALHGAGSDRWQFIRDPRAEARAVRDVATAQQMILIAPDYRATESWMNSLATSDVLQIIQAIRLEFRVGRVFICGGSMGGSACLTFAALYPDLIDGVVSLNGTANYFEQKTHVESIQRAFGGTKAEVPEEYQLRSAEYWPERLTMPTALVVGGQDRSLPPHSARRLAHLLDTLGHQVLLIDRTERGHDATYGDTLAALEFATQRLPIPDGLVVLTFDDRAKSWATNVAPILQRYRFGATFFVTDSQDFGYYQNNRFWASWQEIASLNQAGFEIGNHSQNHANFANISPQEMIAELRGIEQTCRRHSIPRPISFAYPGAAHGLEAVNVLQQMGYALARRGVFPEFPNALGSHRGAAYEPGLDHPLLIPGTYIWGSSFAAGSISDTEIYRNGGSELGSTFQEFVKTVALAKDGKVVVLVFHGVPDYYPHCSTKLQQFERCMQHLHEQSCHVIAVRDLLKYVDPSKRPDDPLAPIQRRLQAPPAAVMNWKPADQPWKGHRSHIGEGR